MRGAVFVEETGTVYLSERLLMPVALRIPDDFARAIERWYGERGRAWLDALPDVLAACAARWRFTLGPPFVPLSYNYVAAARCDDGTAAVLKAIAPHPPEERAFEREAEAVRRFSGRGGVRLLECDPENAVLLIERCVPGTLLRAVSATDDDRAVALACDVMRGLWQPPPATRHPFPHMDDGNAVLHRLRPSYGGGTGPFPVALIETVERLLAALAASAPAPLLLHGDLHHDNIVAAGGNGAEAWRAIDPKGVIGDPAYEVGAMLYNPQPDLLRSSDPARVLARQTLASHGLGLASGYGGGGSCGRRSRRGGAWRGAMRYRRGRKRRLIVGGFASDERVVSDVADAYV